MLYAEYERRSDSSLWESAYDSMHRVSVITLSWVAPQVMYILSQHYNNCSAGIFVFVYLRR